MKKMPYWVFHLQHQHRIYLCLPRCNLLFSGISHILLQLPTFSWMLANRLLGFCLLTCLLLEPGSTWNVSVLMHLGHYLYPITNFSLILIYSFEIYAPELQKTSWLHFLLDSHWGVFENSHSRCRLYTKNDCSWKGFVSRPITILVVLF